MKKPSPNLATICIAASLFAAAVEAQEPLIERVVVRNRLYTVNGRPEVGLNVGFSLLSRLTDHINFNAHFAYNLAETFALELRAGYAYSRHTGIVNDLVAKLPPEGSSKTPSIMSDLSDLWEMNGNAVLGLRWAPIYGKLSLMAELPVHFQAYLWAGAGAGQFHRESFIICNQKPSLNPNEVCAAYYQQDKVGAVASGAFGLRFFATPRHSITIEVRDYSYPDSYLNDVNREAALNPSTPDGGGTPALAPGFTNLVQVDLGYSFIF